MILTDTATWERLFIAAASARVKAHAPYSQFQVGAAGLLADGSIVSGCNVENASFGLTVCAERHVVAAAVLAGQPQLRAIALVADGREPVSPCGACRQVLAEVAPSSLPIRSRTPAGVEASHTLGALLPHGFGPEAFVKVKI